MIGLQTCATCKHFLPLSEMTEEESRVFLNACDYLGIEHPEDYGYCTLNEDDYVIVKKDSGKNCKWWEER